MTTLSGRPLLQTRADQRLFVDRRRELIQIDRNLQHGLNTLLLGARGSGKTSLLNAIARRSLGEPRRSVFIDAAAATGVAELLRALAGKLRGEAGGTRVRLGSEAPLMPMVPAEAASMIDLLGELVDAGEGAGETLVLVDDVYDPAMAHTLFGRFRDELWQLPCTWIVAGDVSDRAAYQTPPADAFFESVVELHPLNARDSADLLKRRATPDEMSQKTAKAIVSLAGGNPRRLVTLARKAIVDGIDVDRLLAAEQKRSERVAALSDAARRMLDDIEAHGAASASDGDLLERIGLSRQRAQQLLNELEEAGLVRATTQRTSGRPRKLFELAGMSG